MSERAKRKKRSGLGLTSDHASDARWRTRADATLVVDDLRDLRAIWHFCIVCKSMAHASDVGLIGTIAFLCVIACLPSAIAADYEPLGWFRVGWWR